MADLQVTCISKQNRLSSYEGITHLGGGNWYWTRQQVINAINAGQHSFYTLDPNGRRANVGIVERTTGDYLRTYADNTWNDNLLALPECSG